MEFQPNNVDQRFLTADQLCKPDVLAVQESMDKAFIVDHTVVWEHVNLSHHVNDKCIIHIMKLLRM